MKHLLFLLLFCFHLSTYAGGDSRTIERYKALSILQSEVNVNPEQAIQKINAILVESIQRNEGELTKRSYILLGQCYYHLNQYDLALKFFTMDKSMALESSTNITLLKYLGFTYNQLANFKSSNLYLNKAIHQTKSENTLIEIHRVIGNNYYSLGNYRKALSSYIDVLNLIKGKNNNEITNEINFRIAACYISMGETELGMQYYNASEKNMPEEDGMAQSNVVESKKEVNKALISRNKFNENVSSLKYYQDLNNSFEHLYLAQGFYKGNEIEKATEEIDLFLKDLSFKYVNKQEIEVIKALAKALKKENKNAKALDYLLAYENLKDSLIAQEKAFELKKKALGMEGLQNVVDIQLMKKDQEITNNLITHLVEKGQLKDEAMNNQKQLIVVLVIALILIGFTSIYIIRVSSQRRIANQQLAVRSLRSQMNPHFIFNALNSVNSFISISDERAANKFLTSFSTLMRTVMENSEYDFIPLSKEIEILKIYLQLEHFRFKDKFEYELFIEDSIDEDQVQVPPMLVQPFIENAVWHGLRYKDTLGKLNVNITQSNKVLKIEVIDNGIGRSASKTHKTKNQKKNKSIAINNIYERIKIFESLYKIKIKVSIENLKEDGTGTIVSILIPNKND